MPSWAAVAVFGLLTGALSTGYTLVLRSLVRPPRRDVPAWRVMAVTFGGLVVNLALYVLAGVAAAPPSFVGAWTVGALVAGADTAIGIVAWRRCGLGTPLTPAKVAAVHVAWIALGGLCAAFGAWLAR